MGFPIAVSLATRGVYLIPDVSQNILSSSKHIMVPVPQCHDPPACDKSIAPAIANGMLFFIVLPAIQLDCEL